MKTSIWVLVVCPTISVALLSPSRTSAELVIAIEHPSLEAYAAHRSKLQAHEGWAKLLAEARETGRTRVSNSLLSEVTP